MCYKVIEVCNSISQSWRISSNFWKSWFKVVSSCNYFKASHCKCCEAWICTNIFMSVAQWRSVGWIEHTVSVYPLGVSRKGCLFPSWQICAFLHHLAAYVSSRAGTQVCFCWSHSSKHCQSTPIFRQGRVANIYQHRLCLIWGKKSFKSKCNQSNPLYHIWNGDLSLYRVNTLYLLAMAFLVWHREPWSWTLLPNIICESA